MTGLEKLLHVAFAEEGYLEKRSNADLDSKTANAGQNNWTKYWRDMKPDFQGQPWCDCFVSWCFLQAFGEQLANDILCGGLRSYYTPTSAAYFAQKGLLTPIPQIGDQVFFTKNGAANGCYHTGIVTGISGGFVLTIEGNTSGASGVVDNGGGVARKSYSLGAYTGKMLFGHPRYNLYSEPAPKKVVISRPEDVKMKHLKSNATGKAVKIWQIILGIEPSGVFDLKTEKATLKWKKEHNLDDSPSVGEKAWRIGLESIGGGK